MNFLDQILLHSPILAVAVPLLGAFLTPLISRVNEKARNIFAILIIILTTFIVFLLANDVFSNGIRTYIFGAQDLSFPVVRILFVVDAMSAI